MEELLSEVQILRRIPHEHIVRLYGLALEWQEHAATDTASVVSRTSSVVSKATTTTIDSQDDLYHSTDALQRAMTDLKAVHIVMELCSFSLDEYMRMSAAYIPEQASDGSASVTPSSTASTRSIASTRSSVWSTPPPLDALQRARILQQVTACEISRTHLNAPKLSAILWALVTHLLAVRRLPQRLHSCIQRIFLTEI